MIPRYRVLAERIRTELTTLEQVITRAEGAMQRATRQEQDHEYFTASAALDLHSFYSGIERLLELVAGEIDKTPPTGSHWHRDLLVQMRLAVPEVRPAVLSQEAYSSLIDYLEFRHVVRNVYTINLRAERVGELVHNLRPIYHLARRDLLAFAKYLDELSMADQEES